MTTYGYYNVMQPDVSTCNVCCFVSLPPPYPPPFLVGHLDCIQFLADCFCPPCLSLSPGIIPTAPFMRNVTYVSRNPLLFNLNIIMSTYKRSCEADIIVLTCHSKVYGSKLTRKSDRPFFFKQGFRGFSQARRTYVKLCYATYVTSLPIHYSLWSSSKCSGSVQFQARPGCWLFVVLPSPSSPGKCLNRSFLTSYH
jgi:hypothetical protein